MGLDYPGSIASALKTLAEEMRLNTAIQIDVTAPIVEGLSPTIRGEMLSIAREALTNAVRHAAATRVAVTITAADGVVLLEIADDGTGFDALAPAAEGHNGLTNMRRRAESLGGTLRVDTGEGNGTRIIVSLPLPE